LAPENFTLEEDFASVTKQPETAEELANCEAAVIACPTQAIDVTDRPS
jgi:ferredoxin